MFGRNTEANFPVAFPALIERKTATGPQTFRINVQGHFVPRGGNPHFTAEVISVDGIKDMNIRSFYPGELNVLTDWTMKNVWPNLGKYMVK